MNTNPTPAEHDEDKPKNGLDAAIVKIGNALSLLFIFTVIISFYEVLMRYVFDSPTIWVHETASFLGGSLFIVGGLYAMATNKHVRVVLLYDMVSPRTRQYLNMFHHVMGLLFSVLMSWASYTMAREAWITPWGEMRLETSGSAWNPPFPALLKGIIFICLCVLSVQFLLHLIAEIRGLRKKDV
ncbi:TRAP transporter small permease subunit [Photobacterium halotolerans]|uniref:TRAP transporter small permease subunit n=1 Tax=Photobacterium halotolerans TaxID=265726 RepID=UPI0013732FA9|nr:TRAP transporter small permease subunit [Photobacterium halotolerans]NAW88882.1 TRAP transporter small permease subunit [Photobacterium halotolerans]